MLFRSSDKASKIANYFGLNFERIEIKSKEVGRGFFDLVRFLDEPIADLTSYAYFKLGARANELGIKVLLSGHGGDELFWGYSWIKTSVEQNIRRFTTIDSKLHFFSYFRFTKPQFTLGQIFIWMKKGFGLIENLKQQIGRAHV